MISRSPTNPALPSFRTRVLAGALYTVTGFGASQIIRLASNLVLTRLLFPEAFGLLAIVTMFMTALFMLSDIGITPAIVQHKRGLDEPFLNTAWTLQIIRGLGLWVAVSAIAWPVSLFYKEPRLVWMLPIVGANAVISAFGSTSLATLSRELKLGKKTVIDIISQLVSVAVMVAGAWLFRSVWALVAGGLTATLVTVILSHVMLPGVRHRFCLEAQAREEIFRFGRWITLSTASAFLGMQGDRAILSTFVSMAMVGVYSIAANLAQMMVQVCTKLTGAVLFPVYSQWGRQDPEKLAQQVRRVRVKTIWGFALLPAALSVLGEPLVRVMYDARYQDAGWITALLSIGVIPQLIISTVDPVLLATGDSFRHMMLSIARTTVTLIAMGTGAWLADVKGLVIGNVVANLLHYPLLVVAIRKKGVLTLGLDLLAFAAAGVFIVLGRMMVRALGI